jgi:hypothetical protein
MRENVKVFFIIYLLFYTAGLGKIPLLKSGCILKYPTMNTRRLAIMCCVCVSLIAASAFLNAATDVGTILKVRKDVYRIRNKDRIPAKSRMTLILKDEVETGKHARAKLSFKDNSIIILGELSRMEVTEYLFSTLKKKSNSVYRLINGSLKVIVGRSDLKIHTLSALVAARGTEFIIWIGKEGGKTFTGVIMTEGEVTAESSIKGVKGKVTVRKGQMTRVFLNEPPEKPRPTDVKMLDEVNITLGEIQLPSGTSKKSEVSGEVLNKADIKDTSNVAIGEGSQANTGSVVME